MTLYEILMAQRVLLDIIPPCSCGPEYTERGLVSPNCVRCQLEPELSIAESAMHNAILYEGIGVPDKALVMVDESPSDNTAMFGGING